jgi:Lon protease-like protein
MPTFLPLFPLNLVAYPGEKLNLHIFEPRYRQLIDECLDQGITFGIPPYFNSRLPGYGTEMQVTQLVKRYEDGRMDIRTKGLRVFRITDFMQEAPGKLYAGAEVVFVEQLYKTTEIMAGLLDKVKALHNLLETSVDFDAQQPNFSYQVAHKVGLSIEQEYELLTIESEAERQVYLIKHLERAIPLVTEMERTKERIRQNGHFKNLDPLNF